MKLVVLDRDGVINQDSDKFIKTMEEWIPLPGSIEAIAELSQNGFTVAVATNQSGIARGLITPENLQAMHNKLEQLVEEAGGSLAKIVYCPHGPDDGCNCRKPQPGLIYQLFDEFGPADQCWMIGDSLRDLQAGLVSGCTPILVQTGKGKKTLQQGIPTHTQVFDDLGAAAGWLIDQVGSL